MRFQCPSRAPVLSIQQAALAADFVVVVAEVGEAWQGRRALDPLYEEGPRNHVAQVLVDLAGWVMPPLP